MKQGDIVKKTKKELDEILHDKRARAEELKFMLAQKKVKNVRELREVKKDIARLLTVRRQASHL